MGSGTKQQVGGGRLEGGDPQEMRQWGRSTMDESKEVGLGEQREGLWADYLVFWQVWPMVCQECLLEWGLRYSNGLRRKGGEWLKKLTGSR